MNTHHNVIINPRTWKQIIPVLTHYTMLSYPPLVDCMLQQSHTNAQISATNAYIHANKSLLHILHTHTSYFMHMLIIKENKIDFSIN